MPARSAPRSQLCGHARHGANLTAHPFHPHTNKETVVQAGIQIEPPRGER